MGKIRKKCTHSVTLPPFFMKNEKDFLWFKKVGENPDFLKKSIHQINTEMWQT